MLLLLLFQLSGYAAGMQEATMAKTPLEDFLTECVARDPEGDGLSMAELYGLYLSWCVLEGRRPRKSRGPVELHRFSSPPSLENREPPRLSPGIRAEAFLIRRPTEPHSGQESHPSRIGPLGDTVIHRPAEILSGRHGAADSLGRQAGD